MAKKLKDVLQKAVKNNPEPARGTNYVNPGQLGQYSAQNQVAEDSQLGQYLKSKGVNASVLTTDQKISHGKSNSFKKWRDSHKFEEVEYVNEDALLDRYLKSRGINPEYAPKNTKIAHSKSTQFIAWKKQHMNEESITESPKEGGKKKFSGMYNPAPKGTFAYDQALRKKKHDEIEKNQSKDGSGMTSAIDRLEKHLNKEEVELEKKASKYDFSKTKSGKPAPKQTKPFRMGNEPIGKMKEEVGLFEEALKTTNYKPHDSHKGFEVSSKKVKTPKNLTNEYGDYHIYHGTIKNKNGPGKEKKFVVHDRPLDYKFMHNDHSRDEKDAILHHLKKNGRLTEETQLNEIDQKFIDSLNKLAHKHKEGDRVTVDSKFFGKQKGKVTKVDNQSIHVQRDGKKFSEKYPHDAVVKENTLDPNAATEAPADGANGGNEVTDHNTKKPRSKLLTKIKSICQPVKEEMYDWEKDDKKQNSLGKKSPKSPSLEKEDPNALPNGEPKARAVMSGGKTMTGEPRDSVTIDPEMEARPDLSKNNKDDKDAPVGNKKLDNK